MTCVTLTPEFGTGYIRIMRDEQCSRIQGELTVAPEDIASAKPIADLPGPYSFPTTAFYEAPAFFRQSDTTLMGSVGLRGLKSLDIVLQSVDGGPLDMSIPTRIGFQVTIPLSA